MNTQAPTMPTYVRVIEAMLGRMVASMVAGGLIRSITRPGLVPNWFWRKLPVERTFAVSLPQGNTLRYRSSGRDAIGRQLFWRGLKGAEYETIAVFWELARRSRLVLDIGANTGLYALLACAANPDARVVAFEPVPGVHERLVRNLELNGVCGRCEARQEAVSSAEGTAEFHVDFGDVPTSSCLDPQGFRGHDGYLLRVPLTTVDAVCSGGERVGLVKIDVEGFEHEVLKGMQRVMSRWAPAIILECHAEGPIQELESILSGFGYRFFALCKHGPVAVDRIVPDPRRVYRNFLFTAHDE